MAPRLLLGDGRLGLREPRGKLDFEPLAAGLGFGGERRTRLLSEPLRARLGLREGLLIGLAGLLGLDLHGGRVVEVARDRLAAVLDDAGKARQNEARHENVEQDERDRQPEELASEGRSLERRKAHILWLPVRFRGGVGRLCLGHAQESDPGGPQKKDRSTIRENIGDGGSRRRPGPERSAATPASLAPDHQRLR